MSATAPVPNIGNMNDYKDNNKRGDGAKAEHHKYWDNHNDNSNSIEKGKDKVFDKNNHIVEDSDGIKIGKGKVKVSNKYAVSVFDTNRPRYTAILLKENVSTAHQWFDNNRMKNVKENT